MSDSHIIRLLKRHAHTGGAPTCQYNLAVYYDLGHKGLRRDPVEARRLYELAAKQGHRRAAHDLWLARTGMAMVDRRTLPRSFPLVPSCR